MALAVGLIVGAGGLSVVGGGVTVGVGGGGGDGLDVAVGEGSGVCDGGAVRLGSGVAAGMVRVLTGPPGSCSRVRPGEQPPMKAAIASADSARARVMARSGLTKRRSRLCSPFKCTQKTRPLLNRSGLGRVLGNRDSNSNLLIHRSGQSGGATLLGGYWLSAGRSSSRLASARAASLIDSQSSTTSGPNVRA